MTDEPITRDELAEMFREMAKTIEAKLGQTIEAKLGQTIEDKLAQTIEDKLAQTIEDKLGQKFETLERDVKALKDKAETNSIRSSADASYVRMFAEAGLNQGRGYQREPGYASTNKYNRVRIGKYTF